MQIKSICGSVINQVANCKYLGSYNISTKNYVSIMIDKAGAALNSMNVIWKAQYTYEYNRLNRNCFRVAV